jgi:hypothetical protein
MWPKMFYQPDGTYRVFEREEDVLPGWLTFDQLRALDHDKDGKMGGSPKRKGKR